MRPAIISKINFSMKTSMRTRMALLQLSNFIFLLESMNVLKLDGDNSATDLSSAAAFVFLIVCLIAYAINDLRRITNYAQR